MPKYRKKPVVIEAVQLRWDTWNDVCDLAQCSLRGDGLRGLTPGEVEKLYPEIEPNKEFIYAVIPTPEGPHLATQGDYIIRGVKGELYPCKPDIFEATYEIVEE